MAITTHGSYQRAMGNPLNSGYETATEESLGERYRVGKLTQEYTQEEAQSLTGEKLATISNRIADVRGVTQSLFGRLSPILVSTPEVPVSAKPTETAPTKLGQSLDEIIDQLDAALSYLRDLHEAIRL